MSGPALVIDGYNVIRAVSEYARLADEDMEVARARLLRDAERLAAGRPCTVVFDGGANPGSDGQPHELGGVTVIFSSWGRSADDVVERLAARARERREPTVVVTSDSGIRSTAAGDPVTFMAAASFAEEVAESPGETSAAAGRRAPLEERIPPETREILERWARGER